MKAKTIKGSSPSEIETALQHAMIDGFKPTIAVVFVSIKQDWQAIANILNQAQIDILGATSCGEFIDGHQSEGETAILLLDINKSYYTILYEEIGERSLTEVVTNLSGRALQKFSKPGFILCSTLWSSDGKMLEGETLIHSLEQVMGPHISMYGGIAGDDMTFTGAYVFTNEKSTEYGIAALVLDEDKISMQGMAISGWKPMGVARVATKTEDNLIYTIDDRPALEMYLRFLGEDISSTDDQINFFDSIGLHYPLQIERENRAPMMCNPMGYNREKGALFCESNVAQGTRFRFSMPPDFDIIESVVGTAKELKNETQTDADALLIFSCASRLSSLGPMAQEENEGLHEVWNAPMAGFYTYGEYGRAVNGKHEFHSTTCCWVALKEK